MPFCDFQFKLKMSVFKYNYKYILKPNLNTRQGLLLKLQHTSLHLTVYVQKDIKHDTD